LHPRFQYNGLRIFEALAASGLRSIRYFKEVPHIDTIHVNDLDPSAVASIQRNGIFNGLDPARFIASQGDALGVMYANRPRSQAEKRGSSVDGLKNFDGTPLPPPGLRVQTLDIPQWDVIDLDPYGSAAPFVDAAVQAVEDGGLLLVTCTDMGVLCGSHLETTFAKYGAMPMTNHACHEGGVRLVLGMLDTVASRYQRSITPLAAFAIDFYLRVFVRVTSSAAQSKLACARRGYAYNCVSCKSIVTHRAGRAAARTAKDVPLSDAHLATLANNVVDKLHYSITSAGAVGRECGVCGGVSKLAGPMWMGPLHDVSFARRCRDYVRANRSKFGTHARIEGFMSMAMEELPDAPFFWEPSVLSNVLHTTTPRAHVLEAALRNAGFRYSETHCAAGAFKTTAPPAAVYDIMRAYVATAPPAELPSTASLTRVQMLAGRTVVLEDGTVFDAVAADAEDARLEAERRAASAVALATVAQTGVRLSGQDSQRLSLAVVDAIAALRAEAAELLAMTPGERLRNGRSPGVSILAQPLGMDVDFSVREDQSTDGVRKAKIFFPNPESHWGPKAAAGIFATDKKYDDPRIATVTGRSLAEEADAAATIYGADDGGNAAAAMSASIVAAQAAKMRANQGKRSGVLDAEARQKRAAANRAANELARAKKSALPGETLVDADAANEAADDASVTAKST
jgi:tRNA(guanine-26,N2-N2) methyltransferase